MSDYIRDSQRADGNTPSERLKEIEDGYIGPYLHAKDFDWLPNGCNTR